MGKRDREEIGIREISRLDYPPNTFVFKFSLFVSCEEGHPIIARVHVVGGRIANDMNRWIINYEVEVSTIFPGI